MKKLISLKGFPKQILPTLQVIHGHQDKPYPDNKNNIKRELDLILPKLSPSKNPKPENLRNAQAIPTCERLNLITKDRKNRRLTFYGNELIASKDDEEKFKAKLGAVLLDFDTNENCKIIETLQKLQRHPGSFVSFHELIEKLKESEVDASLGSRLKDLLQYYEYVGLVITKKDTITLLESRIRDISKIGKSAEEISDKEFFGAVYHQYKIERVKVKGSPYVPIFPFLKEGVCKMLNIGENEFNKKLLSFPFNFGNKQILLSPAMRIQPRYKTIKKGKDYYYYISIYEKGENKNV